MKQFIIQRLYKHHIVSMQRLCRIHFRFFNGFKSLAYNCTHG